MNLHDHSFDSHDALDALGDWLRFERHDHHLPPSALEDVIREMLVGGGEVWSARLEHATLEAIRAPATPVWALLALHAVHARSRGDVAAERDAVLEAIRRAPGEIALFLALARIEWESGSALELFALSRARKLGYYWSSGSARLEAAAFEACEELEALLEADEDELDDDDLDLEDDVDWDSDGTDDWRRAA